MSGFCTIGRMWYLYGYQYGTGIVYSGSGMRPLI